MQNSSLKKLLNSNCYPFSILSVLNIWSIPVVDFKKTPPWIFFYFSLLDSLILVKDLKISLHVCNNPSRVIVQKWGDMPLESFASHVAFLHTLSSQENWYKKQARH